MWYNDSNYLLRKSWKRRRIGKPALRTFTVSSIPEYRSWFSTTSGLKRFGAYIMIQIKNQASMETESVDLGVISLLTWTLTVPLNTDSHRLYIHFAVESQPCIFGHARWKGEVWVKGKATSQLCMVQKKGQKGAGRSWRKPSVQPAVIFGSWQ